MEKTSGNKPNFDSFVNDSKRIADDFMLKLLEGDPMYIGIVTAVVVGIFTLLLLLLKRGSSRGKDILILGLCDSGKTLLFSQLIHGKHYDSYTSIQENRGTYLVKQNKKSLELVDLPGHERVRGAFIERNKNSTRGIIYMVDSLTIQKEIKDTAEFLYSLLTDRTVVRNGMPILVVCNKQDQTMAKGKTVVQNLLQKEFNTLRITKSAALAGTSDSGQSTTYLGKEGKDFEFSDLRSVKMQFVEASAKTKNGMGEPKIEEVKAWLATIA